MKMRGSGSSTGGGGGGRSSTASHFEANFGSLTAGTAADDFYGIPLQNDIMSFSMEYIVAFGIFLAVMAMKPHLKVLKGPGETLTFWFVMFLAACLLKEILLYPMLTTIIFTRTSYPYMVVIPHCMVAAAAYRKERQNDFTNNTLHYLPTFGLGFFCFGFGGSIVSDVLMGLPATACGHARIVPCWILGWILVWFSPQDLVYKLMNDKSSFVHYLLSACEAIDAVTTPMGRVSRSARELQNKGVAPILAGLFAGAGGAVIRYGERVLLRNQGPQVAQESRNALEAGVWRTLGYAVLWWYLAVYKCTSGAYAEEVEDDPDMLELYHCKEYNGHNLHRFVIVLAHVVWNFACDLGMASGHPIVKLCEIGRNLGSEIVANLGYGPPQPSLHSYDSKDEEEASFSKKTN